MRWRMLFALLSATILLMLARLDERSQAERPVSSRTASTYQGTWKVENRCRANLLPLILKRNSGFAPGGPLPPASSAQASGLDCIQISDSDLAELEWEVLAEVYARQANRNRERFGFVPIGPGAP
jgi:hypothetical protein